MARQDSQNELLFLERTKIEKVLEEIKSENLEYTDTIQVQINLKGLDPRRDNKITKDITMPYKTRCMGKIVVLADRNAVKVCNEKNIPFFLIDDLMQDKMAAKKDEIFRQNKYFILCKGSNKIFQTRVFLRAGKIPYMLKDDDNIEQVYNNALKMYRLRVKDMSVTSFPIGDTKMPNEELYENLVHGMIVLVKVLKKGEDNLMNVFLKGAQKAPKKIY